MTDINDALTLADLRRRLSNIVRIGAIAEVDYEKAVARVTIGTLKTTWLPWILRAGDDKAWHGVDIGEQVVVLSPYGDLVQAVILPSLHKETPVRDGNVLNFTFKDGSGFTFDRTSGNLTATVKGNADITCRTLSATCQTMATIKAPTITLDGNVTVTGAATVNGAFAAMGTATLGNGGSAIARIGDSVQVNANTHTGTITSGSANSKSG